jgi:hypothetical protein
MTDLAALVVRMQADNSQYIKALDQATSKLQSFSKDSNEALAGLADKIGSAFAVGKIAEFAASSIESAASLERLSQSAGVSVEGLSAMTLAAAASGLSQDELGLSLKKLNVNIAEAAGNAQSKAAVAFRALGIDVKNANGSIKDAGQILPEIANKFAQMADGPNKTAFAVQLLGRQGQALIPVLDQGAAGLAAFKAQAEAAGIVMSGQLAAAAEEFSQKLSIAKATAVDGLGIAISAQLLPVLNSLVSSFEANGTGGEKFRVIAEEITTAVQLVASVVIEAVAQFQKWGTAIGATAAAAVQAAQGNFTEAAEIWKQGAADNVATEKAATDALAGLWHQQTATEIAAAKEAFDAKEALNKGKGSGPNLEAAEAGAAGAKELEKYRDGLKDQASAFDLGGAALTAYKLKFGPLADAIKAAGAEGQKIAKEAQSWANKLQLEVDTKKTDATRVALENQVQAFGLGRLAAEQYAITTGELGKAFDRMGTAGRDAQKNILSLKAAQIRQEDAAGITQLDNEALKLAGHLHEAAMSSLELQTRQQRADYTATGNQTGLDDLDRQQHQVDLQGLINDLNLRADAIKQQLEITTAALDAEVTTGQKTELEGQQAIAAARLLALGQLQAIGAQEQTIANDAGASNVQLVAGVQKFQSSLVALQATTTQLENSVRSGLESAFADNFSKLISGAESFRKALRSFFTDIEKQLDQLVAKDFSQSVFGTGGAGGGVAGALAGIFGGGLGGGGAGGMNGIMGLFGGGGAGVASTGAAAAGVSQDSIANSISVALPGFAEGGTLGANRWGIVGEKGKELVYSGAHNMNVIPAASGKTQNVTNHFTIQAPGGTISRASQMQTAAAAARSLAQANRRNNQ